MESVEAEKSETGSNPPKPPVASASAQGSAETNPPKFETSETKPVAGILGKLFKRNGRHPKDCQCPLHARPDGQGRFVPPPLPDKVQDEDRPAEFLPPAVPADPRRFEVWGRLAGRAVKVAFAWLTGKVPGLCARAVRLGGMTEQESEAIRRDLPITAAEVADIESSASRVAAKWNLTTGWDEEIELVVTVGSVFARAGTAISALESAVKKLEEKAA